MNSSVCARGCGFDVETVASLVRQSTAFAMDFKLRLLSSDGGFSPIELRRTCCVFWPGGSRNRENLPLVKAVGVARADGYEMQRYVTREGDQRSRLGSSRQIIRLSNPPNRHFAIPAKGGGRIVVAGTTLVRRASGRTFAETLNPFRILSRCAYCLGGVRQTETAPGGRSREWPSRDFKTFRKTFTTFTRSPVGAGDGYEGSRLCRFVSNGDDVTIVTVFLGVFYVASSDRDSFGS